MKRKLFVCSFFAILCSYVTKAELKGISFFSPRSQSENAARELVGWHPFIHRYGMKKPYGVFSVTPAYAHSVRPNRIAETLFGTTKLFISGSQVVDRDPCDILADYFGLSTTFQSNVCLDPQIANGSLSFNYFLGFNIYECKGFYLQIHAPLVWTRWTFELDEEILNNGLDTAYPARYMDIPAVCPPEGSFTCAIKGTTFGQMQCPLDFGRIACSTLKETKMSDVQVALGWDFILEEDKFAGLNLRFAAPTGTRPNSNYLFEPIVGNGHHWELGVGFAGRVLLWEKDGEQELSLWGYVNLTHMFAARQCRSFDLCCPGFLSRYILAKEFDCEGNYTGHLLPAINVTTLSCDVSMAVQMDAVLMFGYTYNGFVFDLGYEGWIRSHEKIELNQGIPENRYALKGIQNVATPAGGPSNATESCATIRGEELVFQMCVADENPPVFFNTCDLNLSSAASPRLITHKFFTHIGYAWECENWWYTPFVGVGGSIEFEGTNPRNQKQPHFTTLNQWEVWLKAGIAIP